MSPAAKGQKIDHEGTCSAGPHRAGAPCYIGLVDDDHDNDDRGYGEKSRYGAHLDRGWDLLGRGDYVRARASAQAALGLEQDGAPDAHMLVAAIEVAEGRPAEAAAAYQRAIAVDPEYPEPYLALAQVQLLDLGDFDRAAETCTEALSLEHLMPIERIDATTMLCETALRQGRTQAPATLLESLGEMSLLIDLLEAVALRQQAAAHGDVESSAQSKVTSIRARTKRAARQHDEAVESAVADLLNLPAGMFESDELEDTIERSLFLAVRTARLFLDVGKPARARTLVELVTRITPDDADAWSFMMEARMDLGEPRGSVLAALQSYRAESLEEMPAWAPSAADLHRRVIEILAEVPARYLQRPDEPEANLVVLVHESPALELVLEGIDPRAMVLALGLRQHGDQETALTGISIYRRNLVRASHNIEEFERELDRSLREELAAFYQLPDLERIQLGLLPIGAGHDSVFSASPIHAPAAAGVANDGVLPHDASASGPGKKASQARTKHKSATAAGKDGALSRGQVKSAGRSNRAATSQAAGSPSVRETVERQEDVPVPPVGDALATDGLGAASPASADDKSANKSDNGDIGSPAAASSAKLSASHEAALKKLSRKRTRQDS